jgi:AraC-like DNA-binding protein
VAKKALAVAIIQLPTSCLVTLNPQEGRACRTTRPGSFTQSLQGVWLDKRVEKVIQMMRDDVRGELSLRHFAQAVNLSGWRLCHVFKSEVGMPPIKYLRLLRMERAKHLLETSFLSVKEIAYNVGLNDESHFVRDFKASYGLSPACYRAGFKSKHAEETNSNNGTQRKSITDDIATVVKHTILPTLNVIVYLLS